MIITVDDKGLKAVEYRVNQINDRLVRRVVNSPARLTVKDTEVVIDGLTGHHKHTLEVTLPRVISGDYTVWAFAYGAPGDIGKFSGIYRADDCPEWVDEYFSHITVSDCEHCYTNRSRLSTYIVENTNTQERFQVGSSCLADFIGVTHKDVQALDKLKTAFDKVDGVFTQEDWVLDKVLALALDTVTQDKGYEPGVTAHKVIECMERGEEVPTNKVAAFKEHVMGMDDSESDYIFKVKGLMSDTFASNFSRNLLISSACLNPELADNYADEYAGEVDDKLKNLVVTVEKVRESNGYVRISAVDDKKHQIVWYKPFEVSSFLAYKPSPEKGDKLEVSSATVKKHNIFNNIKQTQLTRVRLKA